tara:strand:- start:33246 stop:33533 length:288 start_codon:yes stop_codon:yes gene_type:complete
MIGAYIIHSIKLNRFYIGSTTDINQRLINHNNHHHGKNTFTAKANDWTIFLFIPTPNYPQANRIELLIKKKKSAIFIQNLKKYPELIKKLLVDSM